MFFYNFCLGVPISSNITNINNIALGNADILQLMIIFFGGPKVISSQEPRSDLINDLKIKVTPKE